MRRRAALDGPMPGVLMSSMRHPGVSGRKFSRNADADAYFSARRLTDSINSFNDSRVSSSSLLTDLTPSIVYKRLKPNACLLEYTTSSSLFKCPIYDLYLALRVRRGRGYWYNPRPARPLLVFLCQPETDATVNRTTGAGSRLSDCDGVRPADRWIACPGFPDRVVVLAVGQRCCWGIARTATA